MTLSDAQHDISMAYGGGAYGVFISGIVWLAAAAALYFAGFQISMLVFFFGGMLIHPVSSLLEKHGAKSYIADKSNALSKLGFELTIILFVGLFLAFSLARDNPVNFYAIMLLIIGARYIPFTTLYGQNLFWVLGAALLASGMISILYLELPAYLVAGIGGLIEIIMATVLFSKHKSMAA